MFLSYRLFFVDDTFAQYYYQSRHMASPRPSPPSLRAEAEPCSSSQPPEVVLGNTFVPVLLSLIPCPTPSWQSDGRRDHLMMLTRQLNICIFWQISFIEPWFSWFSCLIHDSQCPCCRCDEGGANAVCRDPLGQRLLPETQRRQPGPLRLLGAGGGGGVLWRGGGGGVPRVRAQLQGGAGGRGRVQAPRLAQRRAGGRRDAAGCALQQAARGQLAG